MVQLHVKRGDESQFLFNTSVDTPLDTLIQQLASIYNGRLKVDRICSGKCREGPSTLFSLTLSFKKLVFFFNECAEITELADHGITLPPNMQGLTEEQIMELKLKDEWEDKCVPSGGPLFHKDDIGRRNGQGKRSTN